MKKIIKKEPARFANVGGVPVPLKHRRAAAGASIGGVGGVLFAALVVGTGPFGIAAAAALGAGTGAYLGAQQDRGN